MRRTPRIRRWALPVLTAAMLFAVPLQPTGGQGRQTARTIEVLFLGHNSKHHDSGRFAPMLFTALQADPIKFTYTAATGTRRGAAPTERERECRLRQGCGEPRRSEAKAGGPASTDKKGDRRQDT